LKKLGRINEPKRKRGNDLKTSRKKENERK
jgi:hypothetical protein